jgi:hypothetical protein
MILDGLPNFPVQFVQWYGQVSGAASWILISGVYLVFIECNKEFAAKIQSLL